MVIKLNPDKSLTITKQSTSTFAENNAEQILVYIPKYTHIYDFKGGLNILLLTDDKGERTPFILQYVEEYNEYDKFSVNITKKLTTSFDEYELMYLYIDSVNEIVFKSFPIKARIVLNQNTMRYVDNESINFLEQYLFKFDGVLNVRNILNYYIEVESSVNKGNLYQKKWVYTPKVGDKDFEIRINVYDDKMRFMETKTTLIKVIQKKSSISSTTNIVCVGDSLTYGGTWVSELNRRLTGLDGSPVGDGLKNIRFVGTQTSDNIGYEGRGGWTWNSYNSTSETMYWIDVTNGMKDDKMQESVWTDGTNKWIIETLTHDNKIKLKRFASSAKYILPITGTLTYVSGSNFDITPITYINGNEDSDNPFYNKQSAQLDFNRYCKNIGIEKIDYMIVFLGWNNVINGNADVNVSTGKQFINSLHSQFSNCKVVISGLQLPSQNGWGCNYGLNESGAWIESYLIQKDTVFKLNKLYNKWCSEDNYKNYINFSHLSGQFDSEHCYPTTTSKVNNRSSLTEEIQNNSIHVNTEGKYLIADAMYRILEHIL